MHSRSSHLILMTAAVAVLSSSATAQRATRSFEPARRPAEAVFVQSGAGTTGISAFGAEALGASVGSALGFGLIYLAREDDCGVEDLSCNLESAAIAIAVGTAGAAAGDYLAGKLFGTKPSVTGAIVGAVAGVAAGIGTWHLFTEELDLVNNPEAATATYVITQGIVTALGSRLVRAIKQ
jgi:CDP-diglyceride synthetase